MKKLILSLLVVAMTSIVMARHVDPATARHVAETYLAAHGMHNPTALVDVSSQTPYSLFYTFVAPDGGFALVSAGGHVLSSSIEAEKHPQMNLTFADGTIKVAPIKPKKVPSTSLAEQADLFER